MVGGKRDELVAINKRMSFVDRGKAVGQVAHVPRSWSNTNYVIRSVADVPFSPVPNDNFKLQVVVGVERESQPYPEIATCWNE